MANKIIATIAPKIKIIKSSIVAEIISYQIGLVKQGGSDNYEYEITQATNNSFKAKAIVVTDFDGDGVFNVWEIDHNKILIEVVKD